MSKPVDMYDDQRVVEMLTWAEGEASIAVGKQGVTRIGCYKESGQMSYIPWFAVYIGDEIVSRYNGLNVDGVHYKKVQP